MELKAGYKQTEVGVIPEDWNVICAQDACIKIQDGTHFSPRLGGNDYLYITSKNIRFGYLDTSSADRIDAAQHRKIYKRCDVRRGDLLLTKDGANTGNAALNNIDEEISLLSSVAFLRFLPDKYDAEYFLQQILAEQGQRQIQDEMAGNAITRLTLEKIKNLRLSVPPNKAEQEAIADALSDADALIEFLEQLIAKKRNLKQGVMEELLTGKKRLPGFRGEWEERTFGSIVERIVGGGTPSRIVATYWNGNIPWMTVKDFSQHSRFGTIECITNEGLKKSASHLIPKHTLITSTRMALGKAVIFDVDVAINQDLKAIFPTKDIDTLFLYYWFQFNEARIGEMGSGSTVMGLSLEDLRKITFSKPPLDEQTAIATILSDMDEGIAALEAKLTKARQVKQGMMQELLTGRIRLI